ncbi:kinase-like domain-containing protein [Xylaria palmicola]|nr:kinase-like domain-containing protein [Xylaria palmicola]
MECLRNSFQNDVLLDGRFLTISPLNHGSFGMVFLARDLQTNNLVAIKCMTKRAAANEAGLEYAIDERSEELLCHRLLAAHPNIVNLIHSFETEAHFYLVLEYCSRGDLYEAIRNDCGPLETEHVRQFMLQLVDAVSYMHSKSIYHRDIKPENIFLTESGAMKLGDFGLAVTSKWSYETTVGSDRYMSPEQYDSAGAGYSPAQADIWAIGICLLNILFSRNPFTTPTEADPLFLDFSRDKQSLFDVFPSMTQDTYEVIVQCMNLDPRKRSLEGAREALQSVVSFTTHEENFDDFCANERTTLATANREPLRTPSIQSPQVDQGAFPWAKALHGTAAQPIRQLSIIPDNESYSEELFPKSEGTTDWCSSSVLTPSISSVLTSNLAASVNSLGISRPMNVPTRARGQDSNVAASLPINVTRTKPTMSHMSLVFGGKNDAVSKSWSDMWEEDVEAEAEEHARQRDSLKEMNSRTWSHDTAADADGTSDEHRPSSDDALASHEQAEPSPTDDTISNDIDDDLFADGFFFHEPIPKRQQVQSPVRYSPPSKRNAVDKWTALGERRRAFAPASEPKSTDFSPKSRRQHGYNFNHYGMGMWDNVNHLSQKWNRDLPVSRGCPWNKGRDWNWREKRHDFTDFGWVGHWQEAH